MWLLGLALLWCCSFLGTVKCEALWLRGVAQGWLHFSCGGLTLKTLPLPPTLHTPKSIMPPCKTHKQDTSSLCHICKSVAPLLLERTHPPTLHTPKSIPAILLIPCAGHLQPVPHVPECGSHTFGACTTGSTHKGLLRTWSVDTSTA